MTTITRPIVKSGDSWPECLLSVPGSVRAEERYGELAHALAVTARTEQALALVAQGAWRPRHGRSGAMCAAAAARAGGVTAGAR